MASDLERTIEQYHRALDAFVRGDPEPMMSLFSRDEGATLANPFGRPARGWRQIREGLDRAAFQFRDGEPAQFERVSEGGSADLAYIVELEHVRARVGGVDQLRKVSLRVTTIFGR